MKTSVLSIWLTAIVMSYLDLIQIFCFPLLFFVQENAEYEDIFRELVFEWIAAQYTLILSA